MTDTSQRIPGCTCLWAHSEDMAVVHISQGRDCPAYPHARTIRFDTKDEDADD